MRVLSKLHLLALSLVASVQVYGATIAFAGAGEGILHAPAVDPVTGLPIVDAHGAAVGHAADHASSAGLPQLDPSTYASQVFWLVIMFAVLYLVFSRRVLPMISSTLENRREHIDSDFTAAERLQKDAAGVHDAYEKILNDARHKADALFKDIETSIQGKAVKDTKSFQDRMDKETRLTEARIDKVQKDIRAEMDGIVAEVARQAAEKIIGVSADLAQIKSMIKDLNEKPKAA